MKPFEKGRSGNPKGRPLKIVSRLVTDLKEEGYQGVQRRDVIDAFEMLLGLPEWKIREVVEDDTQPMLLRIAGKELLGRKAFEVVKDILDRAHGRPSQAVDVTSKGDPVGKFKGFEFLAPLAEQADDDE